MMDDLISRQEAIQALQDAGMINYQATGDFYGIINALTVIKNLPDAGCEYWDTESNYCALYKPAADPRLSEDDKEVIRIHLGAIKEKLCNQRRWDEAQEYEGIIERLNGLPTAEKKGKWNYLGGGVYCCSNCVKKSRTKTNYCPNCGARMEENDEK